MSPSNNPADANISVAPLRNAKGRVISAVVVVGDASDQKRAEHALRDGDGDLRASDQARPRLGHLREGGGFRTVGLVRIGLEQRAVVAGGQGDLLAVALHDLRELDVRGAQFLKHRARGGVAAGDADCAAGNLKLAGEGVGAGKGQGADALLEQSGAGDAAGDRRGERASKLRWGRGAIP